MLELAGSTGSGDVLEALRARLREREELAEISARFEPRREGDELAAAVGRVADVDLDGLSDEVLVELAGSVEAAQRRLDGARLGLHAVLEGRGATEAASGHATRAWLGAEQRLSRPEAGRRVRVAVKVARYLPLVADAVGRGEVTFEHARVLADAATPRVLDLVIGLQSELLTLAAGVRFETWVQQVRDLLAIADPDGGHDPSPERNRVALGDGLDGELFVDVTLVGDAAATVRHALNSTADELFHRARRDAEATGDELAVPARGQLLAQALVELCRRGLTAGRAGPAPATDATIVIDASDPTVGHSVDGVRLAEGTTRLLCCDAIWAAVVRDGAGVPLHLDANVRFATPTQRRAAMVRDGGCVFPGCDAPSSWVDLHHVIHWDTGGETTLENLASLCRHHHGITHRRGWNMTATSDQWFTWSTPAGNTLHSQRHHQPRAPGRAREGPG